MAIDVRAAAQSPGQEQLEIPLHYSRGGGRRQALPAVRVHLTFDEPVLSGAESRTALPICSGLESFQMTAYSLLEIAGEELQALLQQQEKWPRPRDLYDLWFILCARSEPMDGTHLHALFERNCEVRSVRPDVSRLTSATLKEWNRAAWTTQLVPMVKAAPDYDRGMGGLGSHVGRPPVAAGSDPHQPRSPGPRGRVHSRANHCSPRDGRRDGFRQLVSACASVSTSGIAGLFFDVRLQAAQSAA
jgi:hypothetical protein